MWSVTADHADIRLNSSLFQKMRVRFPECSVLHPSVESLVQEFEQAMEQRSKANTSLDWFEKYVRTFHKVHAPFRITCYSLLNVIISTVRIVMRKDLYGSWNM